MARLVQKCSECRYNVKCYSKRASPRNIVINILACRIKKRINANDATLLLLDMVKPSLVKLVNIAKDKVGSGYIDTDSLIKDLESRIIECLLSEDGYQIGGMAFLTEYLFGNNPKTGWVKKWILWHFSKNHRFYKRHTLYGDNPESDTEEEISELDRDAILDAEAENSHSPVESNNDAVNILLDIINDGTTLNANEYRVISFCMSNANESNKARLIDGTHTYLSSIMGVSRPRVTRLFSVARHKILQAAREHRITLN